jgi:hypothetical protein
VPQTGQTQCWDSSGRLIPCDGTGQDGDFQAGVVFPAQRFRDNGDGTVRDNLTGLIWLKGASCLGSGHWTQAFASVAALNAGDAFPCAGYRARTFTDWRLPNARELHSLVDYGFSSPALSNAEGTAQWSEGDAFSGVPAPQQPSFYWTSSSFVDAPTGAWGLHLHTGTLIGVGKDNAGLVWPVRGRD